MSPVLSKTQALSPGCLRGTVGKNSQSGQSPVRNAGLYGSGGKIRPSPLTCTPELCGANASLVDAVEAQESVHELGTLAGIDLGENKVLLRLHFGRLEARPPLPDVLDCPHRAVRLKVVRLARVHPHDWQGVREAETVHHPAAAGPGPAVAATASIFSIFFPLCLIAFSTIKSIFSI